MDENLLLLKFLSRFFHLVAFIWEFKVLKKSKVLKVISIFSHARRWISAYLIYCGPVVCLFSVFASLKYILLSLVPASAELLRIELSWH